MTRSNASPNARLVIIPAALVIAPEMQFDFGPINPCMLPINGRPIIEYLVEQYDDGRTDFEIIARPDPHLQNYIAHKNIKHLKITFIDKSVSLADTILQINASLSTYSSVIINFADTLVIDDVEHAGNCVTYQKSLDLLRWTRFSLDDDHKITAIFDKNTEDSEEMRCFSGVFGIDDPALFFQLLSEYFKRDRAGSFYKTVTDYYNQCKDVNFLEIKQWYDFGHIDNYYKIKRQFFRERDFNTIKNTRNPHTIRKESTNTRKLLNEISWYQRIPDDLKYLLPQIFRRDLSPLHPSLDMEFCSFLPLNELYVFSNFDQYVWFGVFDAIKAAIKELQTYRNPEPAGEANALEYMYLTKTIERLDSIHDLGIATFDKLTVNNQTCYTLEQIIALLPQAIRDIGLYNSAPFSIIHGDLCCSNILFDRKIGQVKLIDPRGRFGEYDIYGDPLYDIAKLSHSFLGDYDLILNNFCDIKRDGHNITLTVFSPPNSAMIKKLFHTMLSDMGYIDEMYKKIRFIESLLFLSMVPLHSDNPKAQEVFLLQGIKLFSDIHMGRTHAY